MNGHTCFELCTESLGFESGDCSVGEGEEQLDLLPPALKIEEKGEKVFQANGGGGEDEEQERVEGEERERFPPPLRWMSNDEGKQSAYIKSERKDGRLILTEVRIERPEVFQVSRENGRLRFSLPWTEEEGGEEAREEELEPVRRQEGFCSYQGAWSGNINRSMHAWWHPGFVTTA